MSYKYLTGRLIETQRSMIGEPAIKIARQIEGLAVTDDGTVKAIDGDGYAVVDELADRYTQVMGNAAEDRLVAAANEFEDDLVLPPALGGPEDPDPAAIDHVSSEGLAVGATDRQQSVGVASDGGTVSVQRDQATPDTLAAAVEPSTTSPEGPTGESASTDEGVCDDASTGSNPPEDVTLSEPHIVEYTVASALDDVDYGSLDLNSVYLMPAEADAWEGPTTVADAAVEALTAVTDLPPEDVRPEVESIAAEHLCETLSGKRGETVSFDVAGVTVTFHRSGSLAVH